MKTKYFDYLPKQAESLQQYLELPHINIEESIKFCRGILVQSPNLVGMQTRIYAEALVKQVAKRNKVQVENVTFNTLLNQMNKRGAIPDGMMKIITQIRKAGNKAAHGEFVTAKDAETSLVHVDLLFRSIIKSANFDTNIRVAYVQNDEMQQALYETFERKFVYVTSVENKNNAYPTYLGLEKIGEASVPDDLEADFRPNSEYLQLHAKKRISQYMTTALLPYQVDWAQLAINNKKKFFSDRDVHAVLKRSGIEPEKHTDGRPSEWFKITVEVAKKAIQAVKEGRESLGVVYPDDTVSQIKFRPEQEAAIRQTKDVFKTKDTMLWNAKMRFGKTLSALQVVKEKEFKKVLIMTHRPVVSDGWFEDFNKIFTDNSYVYGSRDKGSKIQTLVDSNKPFVYFASIQDLRGSTWAGGKQGDKNNEFLKIDWDLIIIDEAHEGNETGLANNVKNGLKREHTKILELSGTPFNLMDKYDEDNIFTWDYTMEQEAKVQWAIDHPDEPNPYSGLPRVSMYTFDVTNKFKYVNETKAFNFKEFFRVEEENADKLVHEEEVKRFLDYITTEDSKTNFPFAKEEFRNNLRHTLWLLPGVKEVNALELVLKEHPVFKEYKVVNVVRDGDAEFANDSDLEKVRSAIGDDPSATKTITLTVRKLTTGVNVPEWTGVFFLSNTESATSYLQAAFRAQTPFNHEKLGIKKNAYIFDFAPDRALKIMSESIGLTSKKGKINSTEQKEKLQNMLNFLPILGQSGNGMKEFSVDRMLTQLKKAYADKAVRSGFEDTSLYNDKLLSLDSTDLAKFKELKEIVGKNNTEAKPKDFIDINKNGFDHEEYDKANKAERKPKKERTAEEDEAVKQLQALRKQKKAMISILRGVSIRIPMMIYGMDIDLDENVTIDRFIQVVDEKSWDEFMPNGLTKGMFKEFTQYYDGEVFVEAGRIIRQRAKSYDKLDVLERTEKIAELFSTFKNPDKETVLTPWRVVNMHLTQTIGGLSYYDDKFENTTVDSKPAIHWVEQDITENIYKADSKILDINSKTGLYPLFVATSMYYKKMLEANEKNAGKFVGEDIWKEVLEKNVYAIAKTPMAKTITQRTLSGYEKYAVNIEFIDGLVPMIKESPEEGAKKIEEAFNKMKFDVVIGNPPYQEMDGGAQASASPVYQYFVEAGKALNPKYMTQITPSRWYVGGRGLDDYRDEMLNDLRLREIHDWLTPEDIFPKTNIRGGICYFLWDKEYDNDKNLIRVASYENGKKIYDVMRVFKIPGINIFVRDAIGVEIIKKVFSQENSDSVTDENMMDFVSPAKAFGFRGFFVKDAKFRPSPKALKEPVKCYGLKGAVGYVERDEVSSRKDWIDKWKIFTAESNNIGTELNDDNLNTILGAPKTVCTETFVVVGAELNLDQVGANNLSRYMKTRFFRYLHSLAKTSQHGTRSTYRFVPIQDFSRHSDIDWNESVAKVDEQLFEKYNLAFEEQEHIKSKIKPME
ncbi:Eco57I restriction-modification methylase domain-containing protein [Enterococcus gallinarum]|uniref:Eco57I restriction-modification methylase domain-containing protein n=1 Tax=Enterococcus gallinarum TaxID=1353 RepID=UPI0022E8EE87|nr:Eco57I restriction-modification methylase domain-containing protein [Enterococcus gallinarum]